MGFLDDLDRLKLDLADQRETQVLDEQLGDFGIRQIGARDVEPKSFRSQRASIEKLNLGVEVGSIVRHSAGV